MIEWLENLMFPCPVYKLSGFPCPGCGMQRAIIELLKGNIIDSFYYYPGLLPLIAMIIILIIHLIFNLRNGAKILKIFFILNVIFISLNYIFKTIVLFI